MKSALEILKLKAYLSNRLNAVRVDEAHRGTVEHQGIDRTVVEALAAAFERLVLQRSLQN